MSEQDEDDPLSNYPHEYPLVAERCVRKAVADAKGHALDFQRTKLVDLGFPWDYWLPYHLARKWKTEKYPTEPTRAAVDQWKILHRECSAFGAIGGIGNTEENFLEYLNNDLKLLAQFDPKLVDPSDLGLSPTDGEPDWKRLISLVSGDNTIAIFNVAQDGTKTADEKMRAIYAIDNRVLGWTSVKWAEVLGVSDPAIRQTDWWKHEREKLRG